MIAAIRKWLGLAPAQETEAHKLEHEVKQAQQIHQSAANNLERLSEVSLVRTRAAIAERRACGKKADPIEDLMRELDR